MTNNNVTTFIPSSQLGDYEITYSDPNVPFSSCATQTHTIIGATSLKNALTRFHKAVPLHGPIKSVRKARSKDVDAPATRLNSVSPS